MTAAETPKSVLVMACGPSSPSCDCRCPDGPCEHVWDGPGVELPDRIQSVTCSRCGRPQSAHDLWVMP